MPKKHKKFDKKAFLKIVLPLVVVVLAVSAGIAYFVYKQQVDDPTRLQVAMTGAIDNATRDAPVEAKTANTYFPALRLYIEPSNDGWGVEDYTYGKNVYDDPAADGSAVISVSKHSVIDEATSNFTNARTSTELFDMVPEAQACLRGVTLTTAPLTRLEDRKFHHKQLLDDGRELYFYYEPACPRLNEVIAELERVKTYTL